MKKYVKPETRFKETSIAERIAGECFGSTGTLDSMTVTDQNGTTIPKFERKAGAWGSCETGGAPETLRIQIEDAFDLGTFPPGQAAKFTVNSNSTVTWGNSGFTITGTNGDS